LLFQLFVILWPVSRHKENVNKTDKNSTEAGIFPIYLCIINGFSKKRPIVKKTYILSKEGRLLIKIFIGFR